jgi:N-acetylmuramoyl-L-alanine amidase
MPRLCLDAAAQAVKYGLNQDSGYTIVLDAGHGGKDSGCLGLYSQEKDVALALTLAVGTALEVRPDIQVVYTRTDDQFLPLYERTAIANSRQADLFVSIHCNGSENTTIHGSETFVMGLHTSEENLAVAKRENRSIYLESTSSVYDGYDPDSPLGHILLAREQQAHLEQSLTLASHIERSLTSTMRRSRGVKQAGFVVLRATSMPSVLVEAGFLTNPTDEITLNDPDNQTNIAHGIADAISRTLAPAAVAINHHPSHSTTRHQGSTQHHAVAVTYQEEVSTTTYYTVRIAELATPPTTAQLDDWEIYPHLQVDQSGHEYTVTVGRFVDEQLATTYKERLVHDGITAARVITGS